MTTPPTKCDNVLDTRPSIILFAIALENRLRENDAKKGDAGWLDYPPDGLFKRLVEETEELRREVHASLDTWPSDPEAAKRETLDVAAFAMMLHDNLTLPAPCCSHVHDQRGHAARASCARAGGCWTRDGCTCGRHTASEPSGASA